MRKVIHKSEERGQANHGWLQAKHSFSFAQYFDPNKIQFGALRVLNDDIIAPSMGFGTHPHDNMEIITIPLSGVLKHRDSMGDNEWQEIKAGEVQLMSAGSGLQHSEINASTTEELKLFQIWIMPNEKNVKPRYDQAFFKTEDRQGQLQTLVTGFSSQEKGLKIHQDVTLSRIDLKENESFIYKLNDERNGVYTMVISGNIKVDKDNLNTRDAIGLSDIKDFNIEAKSNTELLFIEVPMF
ncbi:pirin family protein [Aurantibacter sp.]|uniref:pirin family protein n=1 Tax=Aurantibacter sp. TaxID=2807103 RepID=UPI0035C7D2B3